MEALKERIKLFLTVFQFGMTFFLGTGVSFVTYITKQIELQEIRSVYGLNWDIIAVFHAMFMIASFSCGVYFLIQADAVNDDLFALEEINNR